MAKEKVTETVSESQEVPEVKETKKKMKSAGPYTLYEEWRLERNGKEVEKLKLVKEVLLLPEQAAEMNSQKLNSLVEYIEK